MVKNLDCKSFAAKLHKGKFGNSRGGGRRIVEITTREPHREANKESPQHFLFKIILLGPR
jgi:hypothetical protein